jgi:hypothetical protein
MNGSSLPYISRAVTVSSYGNFVAVGSINGGGGSIYAISSNGSTWTTPAIMGGVSGSFAYAVTVNSSGLFVATGNFLAPSNEPMYAYAVFP